MMFNSSKTTSISIVILAVSSGLWQPSMLSHQEVQSRPGHHDSFPGLISNEEITTNNYLFNMTGKDIISLLHIQKTGGTSFERHLVYDLKLERPCSCSQDRRRCSCPRPANKNSEIPKTIIDSTWLISRFSTGWICGLHPDWSQLTKCLSGLRRVFMLTFLRHPLDRFVSEFRHVQRGATWKASKSQCRRYDTQLCYGNQSSWSDVQLEEFMSCPSNMAINRQTRMLASFDQSMCSFSSDGYNFAKNDDDTLMLKSAIENLNKLAFFGLCERQRDSQTLFEKTFNMKFRENFKQSDDNKTRLLISELSDDIQKQIITLNNLDLELYNYATNLFFHRLEKFNSSSYIP